MLDQRIMNGTCGEVWVDDELWVELESAQAKYTYNKSDINMCGEMTVGSKVTGVKGTGSIVVHKIYTRNISRSDQILAGRDVRAKIIMKLDDPDAFGAERVAFDPRRIPGILLILAGIVLLNLGGGGRRDGTCFSAGDPLWLH